MKQPLICRTNIYANEQAIIANTRDFENKVEKFVVNQAIKEELIASGQSIIKATEE